MVRARFIAQVRYGHVSDYLKALEQLNAICAEQGWNVATFWWPIAGTANEVIAEVDFPDLATFERETEAQGSDAEWMKVVRSAAQLIAEGSGRTEILQRPTEIA